MDHAGYQERLASERETFAEQESIHGNLPESAHHWSARHVLPKLNELAVPSLDELITAQIGERARRHQRDVVVLSLGSGNGDQELGWLRTLAEAGVRNVRMRLLEFNPEMQRRAAAEAEEQGFADRVELVLADFNTWRADAEHDVVVGYQALHHVLDLEHLYGQIRDSLDPGGVLMVHDMIGRNGHRRWPEALEVVERIWATLPPELRRNSITGEVDEYYHDIDCATDGFEGIRAQDVLPVLMDYLHPSLFLGIGNVIDPFVDRVYGHNFDLTEARDRALIERLGVLDDSLVDLGVVTPTRLTAMFHPSPQPLRAYRDRTPERSIRDTSVVDPAGRVSFDPRAADGDQLVRGAGVVTGRMNGIAHDHWAGPSAEFPVLATAEVQSVELRTYLPDWMPKTGRVTVHVDGTPVATADIGHGLTEQVLPVKLAARRAVRLGLTADWAVNPVTAGLGDDRRTLSYLLVGLDLREL
ncbi:class I SAM-dependent methyltransferase [Amycolatopsis nigrescens]|uniref:class I SAM-dependent methyltransferase n=1 Tax=Amycolatopsis nigrescens TaxID=381445 RepID=UPI0003650050|nr:class I SAM-dependent methyltransferase [Amycolatopsis nigrescens]